MKLLGWLKKKPAHPEVVESVELVAWKSEYVADTVFAAMEKDMSTTSIVIDDRMLVMLPALSALKIGEKARIRIEVLK